MTVKELYAGAKSLNLLNEEVDEVITLFNLPAVVFNRGVCGTCSIRKTANCPFPNNCSLCMSICLSYKKIE